MTSNMDKVTIRLPAHLIRRADRQVDRGEYPNRSEAIRSYIRNGLEADEAAEDDKVQPLNPVQGSTEPSIGG